MGKLVPYDYDGPSITSPHHPASKNVQMSAVKNAMVVQKNSVHFSQPLALFHNSISKHFMRNEPSCSHNY